MLGLSVVSNCNFLFLLQEPLTQRFSLANGRPVVFINIFSSFVFIFSVCQTVADRKHPSILC